MAVKNTTLRKQSLLRRAVTSNLLFVSLFAVVLTGLYAELQRVALDQQLRLRAETLTDFLAAESQFGMLVADREGLRKIAVGALSVEDVVSIEVVGSAGETLVADSKTSAKSSTPLLFIAREVSRPGTGGLLEWESKVRP